MGKPSRKRLRAVCLGLALAGWPWSGPWADAQTAPARLSPLPTAADVSSPPLVPISSVPRKAAAPSTAVAAGTLPPLVPIQQPDGFGVPISSRAIASLPVSPAPASAMPAITPLPVPAATSPPVPLVPSRIQPQIRSLPVPPPVAAIASLPPPAVPAVIPSRPQGPGLLPAPLPIPAPPGVPSAPAVPAAPAAVAPPSQPLPQQPAPPLQPAASQSPPPAPVAAPASGKPTDAITIASFNIQVFGESKVAKPQVVDVLARVVRGCDIVAIQEVRAKSDHVIPQFLEAVNADGSRYQFVIGPRLGRTASKEQYVFMYDTNRIEVDPSSVGTAPNPGDKLHRPPMFARFRVRTTPAESGFSFWMVDIHTDPDEVPQEVDALADVFMAMRSARPDEDDVILLGDLNAGPPQFGRLGQIPGIGWAVSGVTTNTRRTKTYDNIIFDRNATTEYTGRWGVLDLQNTFGLTLDKALEVSDHNPVWACFRPFETQRTGSLPATASPQ